MGGGLSILYVVSQWRAPTQTFVRREVDAARAAGNHITILSLKHPAATVEGDGPVIHLGRAAGPLALVAIARHPVRSGRALGRAAVGSRFTTIVPNLAAALIGLAATRRTPPVDWIHAHFAWVAASSADAIAEVRSQPFSVFPHAFDIFDRRFVDRYTRSKLRRAAFVVVESPAIQAEVDERFGCRSQVARMGIPRGLLRLGAAPRTVEPDLIVSVGSLLPKKGHDVLLRALSLIPEARLRVAGDGDRSALERLATELGVADRVTWLGAIPEDDVRDLLDRAAVFCLASRPTADGDRDGVPNVLIEAMARDVPCVSTAVSGIPDLLGEGRGLVVEPDDPATLARAIRQLLDDPGAAARMATLAAGHIAEAYVTDDNWARLQRRIERAMPRRGLGDERDRLAPRRSQHSYLQLSALAAAMREEAARAPDGLVVDLGCGAKPYSELFSGRYLGIDLLATHGDPDCLAWAESVPVRSGVAAVAVSTQQLEHVEDPRAVLTEARRILGPGGVLLLSTHGVWPYHPDPHDYWRWTEEGLTKLIRDAGFEVRRVHRQGGLAAAAVGLLLYPLGAVGHRSRALRPVAGALITIVNIVAGAADRFLDRLGPKHYAAPSYLVVATRGPTSTDA
jgi:colanic acid/amylovoran biosynthesis glycosyltransferase